jgi:hypothetical protein
MFQKNISLGGVITMTDKYNDLCEELELLEKSLEYNNLNYYEKEDIENRIYEIYYELARIDFI